MRKLTLALQLPIAALVAVVLLLGGGLITGGTAHAQPACVELQDGTFCVSLEPESATNNVGTSHTVTATVTFNGSPVGEWLVVIAVIEGPNAGDGILDLTDSSEDYRTREASKLRRNGADLSSTFAADIRSRARTIPFDIGAFESIRSQAKDPFGLAVQTTTIGIGI